MKTQSVSTISGAAIGRWPYILSALGIKVPSAGHHGACPACVQISGTDRPFPTHTLPILLRSQQQL